MNTRFFFFMQVSPFSFYITTFLKYVAYYGAFVPHKNIGSIKQQAIASSLKNKYYGATIISVSFQKRGAGVMEGRKYVIDNAELMVEWNWEKNSELGFNPQTLTLGNRKKVWWTCTKGHEWQTSVVHRNNGSGCPYCSGRYAIKGENDLQTINPSLAREWNYDKNNGLLPADVMPNSVKKVWWKCNNGHEWQATIDSRNRGNGCPYCSGRYAINGENDLQTINPALAREWNYDKNNGLLPADVMPNSSKKVWWKCNKGHEWKAIIANRNKGVGCPICNSEHNTSFPEYAIVYYLKKYGLDAIHSYRERGYELDIYIPSKRIAIEYDGSFWHKDKAEKDLEKNQKCTLAGIKLYRIREELPPLNNSSIDYIVTEDRKELSKILKVVLSEIIGIPVDIDLERDNVSIENLRSYTEKEKSLSYSNPEVSKEWNHKKNGSLKPEYFAANSNKKVWWTCVNGHEWQAMIVTRNKGHGCPYCSGVKALIGYNDLQTVNPTLAKEWNHQKNEEVAPTDVMPNSDKKVWWKCSNGHEWQARIQHRNNGAGCPICYKEQRTKG